MKAKDILLPITLGAAIALIVLYLLPPHKASIFSWLWFSIPAVMLLATMLKEFFIKK